MQDTKSGALCKPTRVLELVHVLVTPSKKIKDVHTDPNAFRSLLDHNVNKLQAQLSQSEYNFAGEHLSGATEFSNCSDARRRRYLATCLALLKLLKLSLDDAMAVYWKSGECSSKPHMSPDLFSVQQQKSLATLAQFVVLLGICPHLQPGVGISLDVRSGFAQLIRVKVKSDLEMYECLKGLLVSIEQPSIAGVILPRHLSDFLAALLQLSYRPPMVPDSQSLPASGPGTSSQSMECDSLVSVEQKSSLVSVEQKSVLAQNDVCFCKQQVKKLLESSYQPLIIRELLILQGGFRGSDKSKFLPAPLWLKKACGWLLSKRLLQPQGVSAVVLGILHGGILGRGAPDDWRRCDVLAKLIANKPVQCPTADEYYRLICPQVLQLIHVKDSVLSGSHIRVGSSCVAAMWKSQPDLTKKYLLHIVMKPLLACSQSSDCSGFLEAQTVITEEELNSCVSDLYAIFTGGRHPDGEFLEALNPVVHILFRLYCFTKQGISHLQIPLQDILVKYLKFAPSALKCLHVLAFSSAQEEFKVQEEKIEFQRGIKGGAVGMFNPSSLDREGDLEERALCIVDLLKELSSDGVSADFFIELLGKLSDIMVVKSEKTVTLANTKELLLNIEEKCTRDEEHVQRSIIILTLLAAMSESLGYAMMARKKHILQFSAVTLQRCAELCHKEYNADGCETDTVSLTIALLTMVIEDFLCADEKSMLKSLLSPLQVISEGHHDGMVRLMAGELRVAIATHTAVAVPAKTRHFRRQERGADISNTPSASAEEHAEQENLEDLLEKFDVESATSVRDKVIQTETYRSKRNDTRAIKGSLAKDFHVEFTTRVFAEAWNDVHSPLLPIRAGACRQLAKLLQSKNQDAVKMRCMLLDVFQKNLNDDDSYLYLAALEGLVSVADANPEETVQLLTAEFLASNEGDRQFICPEMRMKLGEALVKITRNLGEMLPLYSQRLLHTFLCGTRDEDKDIRASSLANLAEVVKLLHFSLGSILQELMTCLSSIVDTDPEPTVRRSAVNVITLMLRGLGKDSLTILESTIRDLYRLLKKVSQVDSDDVVRLHVQLALEELDIIMRGYLFPEESFTRKIRVLDPF